jgi:hypothetical protein
VPDLIHLPRGIMVQRPEAQFRLASDLDRSLGFRAMGISSLVYRFAAASSALAVFFGMSWLYAYGDKGLYENILTSLGVLPFRFPFVDASGSLAAWECARQGVDVIVSDPCDILQRGYNYSPLWMAAARIPLSVGDTIVVGWTLDVIFLMSLCLLPPPRRPLELVLLVAATLSTMVIFALERANPDLVLFLLALAAGLLSAGRLPVRLFGYFLAVIAALIKYYPIMLLVVVFRERRAIFCLISVMLLGSLALFWIEYHAEISRGLPNIAGGRYDTDMFASKNLPFMTGMLAEHIVQPSAYARLVGATTKAGLYAILVGACLAICRRLLCFTELRAGLASLPRADRVLLVIGSAVMTGCFFAGQSIGYRGIFLLLILPGLLGISRTTVRELRVLSLASALVILLLMWGECFRLALSGAGTGGAEILFWLLRELCWWWTASLMLAVLGDFLQDSPVLRHAFLRAARAI